MVTKIKQEKTPLSSDEIKKLLGGVGNNSSDDMFASCGGTSGGGCESGCKLGCKDGCKESCASGGKWVTE